MNLQANVIIQNILYPNQQAVTKMVCYTQIFYGNESFTDIKLTPKRILQNDNLHVKNDLRSSKIWNTI